MGLDVPYQAPQSFELVAMQQLIESAVAAEPEGLVVSIPDAEALGPAIKDAVAAGIPVISMNSGLEVSRKLGARSCTSGSTGTSRAWPPASA